jgi:hypothetical protein
MNDLLVLDPKDFSGPLKNGGGNLSRRNRKGENTAKGKISVSEAGRRGGAKGGPRVRELVQEGKEHENE